jgi:hypothetical protein
MVYEYCQENNISITASSNMYCHQFLSQFYIKKNDITLFSCIILHIWSGQFYALPISTITGNAGSQETNCQMTNSTTLW